MSVASHAIWPLHHLVLRFIRYVSLITLRKIKSPETIITYELDKLDVEERDKDR